MAAGHRQMGEGSGHVGRRGGDGGGSVVHVVPYGGCELVRTSDIQHGVGCGREAVATWAGRVCEEGVVRGPPDGVVFSGMAVSPSVVDEGSLNGLSVKMLSVTYYVLRSHQISTQYIVDSG